MCPQSLREGTPRGEGRVRNARAHSPGPSALAGSCLGLVHMEAGLSQRPRAGMSPSAGSAAELGGRQGHGGLETRCVLCCPPPQVSHVLAALQAGNRGTQACITAASAVSGIIADLDTTIMFATAGTLNRENAETFADHRYGSWGQLSGGGGTQQRRKLPEWSGVEWLPPASDLPALCFALQGGHLEDSQGLGGGHQSPGAERHRQPGEACPSGPVLRGHHHTAGRGGEAGGVQPGLRGP